MASNDNYWKVGRWTLKLVFKGRFRFEFINAYWCAVSAATDVVSSHRVSGNMGNIAAYSFFPVSNNSHGLGGVIAPID